MNSTKMAIKWTRIDLHTIVIPIWNPENKGYKIGFEKRCWGQQECPKNRYVEQSNSSVEVELSICHTVRAKVNI